MRSIATAKKSAEASTASMGKNIEAVEGVMLAREVNNSGNIRTTTPAKP
jgi:hypothetical protein